MMENNYTYNNDTKNTWCPGCGNFMIMAALKKAMANLGLAPENVVLVGDIGCSSKMADYTEVNTFTSLHGRSVPLAEGVKLANHALNVVAVGGDGGLYAEGGNHFIHAARRNINFTMLVNDNQVYALTKGQVSPTSPKHYISGPTPDGVIEQPINPVFVALATGATFVARGYAGDLAQLTDIITKAIKHRGYSLVDVLAPCVSFNKVNTLAYYKDRVYKLEDESAYDKTNLTQALEKAREFADHIPTGILYEIDGPAYEDQVKVLENGPLVGQNQGSIDISPLLVY